MKKSQYLIITALFPPEPKVSARLSKDIADSLFELGREVTVICPYPSRPEGYKFLSCEANEYSVVYLDSYTHPASELYGRFKESYSFGKEIKNYIQKNKGYIKCIYANTWPLLSQYFTVRAAKKYKIPIVLHIQDIYPETIANKLPFFSSIVNLFLLPLDKNILRNATKIIAISQRMKSHLVKTRNLIDNKVSIINNWQDETQFQYNTKSLSNIFTFMYLGNIGPVAGIDLLINAFALAKIKNSRLIIAGSGSMKAALQKMANKITDVVIEFCSVPEGRVHEIQEKSDVLLLPIKKGSALSSIPSKLPAYMFSKKPIIASVDSDSDTADTIKQANCGWVLEPENIGLLSQTMKMAVSSPKTKLVEMGENGFKFALENFSKNKNLRKLMKIIEEFINVYPNIK